VLGVDVALLALLGPWLAPHDPFALGGYARRPAGRTGSGSDDLGATC
jgi:hypothetical protein